MDSLQLTVASSEALRAARGHLTAWLQQAGLPAGETGDVVLAAHEALSVALNHSLEQEPAQLSAVRQDGHVRINVDVPDAGTWTPNADDDSHWALALIRSLPTDAMIETDHSHTRIRLVQRVPPRGSATA